MSRALHGLFDNSEAITSAWRGLRFSFSLRTWVQCFIICWIVCVYSKTGKAQEGVSFRGQIAPLLRDHCLACHGPKKAEGGYRVDNFDALMAIGDSGETPVVPGNSSESALFQRLVHEDTGLRMPAESEPMEADSVAFVERSGLIKARNWTERNLEIGERIYWNSCRLRPFL